MVDWLISMEKARNRPEALMLAAGLLNEGFVQPAGDRAKDGAESAELTTFLDQTDALYYFVSSDESQLCYDWKLFICLFPARQIQESNGNLYSCDWKKILRKNIFRNIFKILGCLYFILY